MVLGLISIIVGIVGFGWAGWKDLRTTEFPDWLPYSMIVAALALRGGASLLSWDFSLLLNSAVVGVLFLGFGLLLYYSKQWGDGDAWLLGAMGFLFPEGLGFPATVLPFPLALLFTFFLVSFAYIIVYSIAVGMMQGIGGKFGMQLKKAGARIVGITAVFGLALVGSLTYLGVDFQRYAVLFLTPFLLLGILIFFQYGRFIEQTVFKRKIPAKNLRVGDVPFTEKWRVLKKKEVQALKKKGGSIWVKEGVRFSPVFVIVLLIMLLFGNILTYFVI